MNIEDIKSKEILLINKPTDITSFGVIRILRKKLGIKKIGHAGTLDPLATGLMILGLNKGTKKLNDFLKLDKVYIATILIGTKTSTGDVYKNSEILEDIKLSESDFKNIEENIENILKELIGEINLNVPIYSAIKINGKRLYDYAFQNKEIETPKKLMKIFYINLLKKYKENDKYIIEIEIKVSSGSYIRSIAEEIGNKLKLPATIKNLDRIQIGDMKIQDSIKLDLI